MASRSAAGAPVAASASPATTASPAAAVIASAAGRTVRARRGQVSAGGRRASSSSSSRPTASSRLAYSSPRAARPSSRASTAAASTRARPDHHLCAAGHVTLTPPSYDPGLRLGAVHGLDLLAVELDDHAPPHLERRRQLAGLRRPLGGHDRVAPDLLHPGHLLVGCGDR